MQPNEDHHRKLLSELPEWARALIGSDGTVHPELSTPCWQWLGPRNRNGYARTSWREPVVHRRLFELLIGPIPAGHVLDHLCRVRHCVNPLHLEPVTIGVNTRRGNAVLFARRSPGGALPADEQTRGR